MSNRAELLERVIAESRRHYAAYTLFNQALADRLGLHPTDVQCLSLLDLEEEPLSTGEIARLTGLTPGSATRLVDRLEKAGLVVRCADPGDRRRTLVTLASDPTAEVGREWDVPGQAFGEVLERYTDDELTVIGDYLCRTAKVGREQAVRLARSGACADLGSRRTASS
ncbi:MarR family winged helix-turn-helix transcriptional regulator [Streptosporangium carneum]|uniref:HTH-type transcriptional regulator YcgE n=1 Tax=Streptosporangium carneum TaxID=47481 RepID=A0A9W6HXF9_9ACTN|nr:MarR family transcriptional regulator [Streptosporangium carneum]GLK08086.1 putative HTH-type transcriptional regulator YcgE [Streptosporangium carneum]